MAKQLNMLSSGQVIPTALHTEMQQSYLEYAMSVIVGRALPDVRDGLKPVHRRILYAMHELGLTPDRPYRKCARVVGDVLGKYHPHGDQAVYDALVRMVQDFSSRYPLLAGHGNFGSVDDDPPAAMRYTETRLAAIGNESLLREIGEATVDFIGNFDNSQQEPTVLPARLPMLLLNGSSGIAVGMATNIPPHNLGEVVDGLIALIDQPNLSDERLLELIPGPDFPTGGEILGSDGIREAYTTGRGSIPVRGVAQLEEIQAGRGRHRRTAIVVTELPYQVNKAAWIEKVAELVCQNKIDGISDIRDESDRDGIRVVIELRRDINPQKIFHQLYRQTALQSNFGVIMLALDNSQPRQMPLRELLQQFLNFREATLARLYRHELTQAETRLHTLEGLLRALSHLDEIIDILRNAPDGAAAKAQFQERFEFSDGQSNAILAMPLRRLTGMERQNLETEYGDLTTRRQELQRLLDDRRELLKALKKELRTLKKEFGDQRRTRIVSAIAAPTPTKPAAESESGADHANLVEPSLFDPVEAAQDTILEISQRGYVRRISPKSFQRQNRNRNGDKAALEFEDSDDPVEQTLFTQTDRTLVVIMRNGKAYGVKVGAIGQVSGRTKGAPLVTLLPPTAQSDPEGVMSCFLLPDQLTDTCILMLTEQGRVKRVPLSDFTELTGRGLTLIKFKEDDQLIQIELVQPGQQLVLATASGRMLRLEINDESLPMQSRASQGQRGMRLRQQDVLLGCVALSIDESLLLVTAKGYVKQLPVTNLRLSAPGELGMQGMHFASKEDFLAGMAIAEPAAEVAVITSENRMTRLAIDSVPVQPKDGRGDRLLPLNPNETVETVALLFSNASSSDP
ncbi:MAG: DNA gyrase subunit A [Leptolyngbyaceae cyanobacterium]